MGQTLAAAVRRPKAASYPPGPEPRECSDTSSCDKSRELMTAPLQCPVSGHQGIGGALKTMRIFKGKQGRKTHLRQTAEGQIHVLDKRR